MGWDARWLAVASNYAIKYNISTAGDLQEKHRQVPTVRRSYSQMGFEADDQSRAVNQLRTPTVATAGHRGGFILDALGARPLAYQRLSVAARGTGPSLSQLTIGIRGSWRALRRANAASAAFRAGGGFALRIYRRRPSIGGRPRQFSTRSDAISNHVQLELDWPWRGRGGEFSSWQADARKDT